MASQLAPKIDLNLIPQAAMDQLGKPQPNAPAQPPVTIDYSSRRDISSEHESAPVSGYEGFYSIALRCIGRGQRPLPITVGAKIPAIKWKGTAIDTASTEEWAKLAWLWVDGHAASFSHAAVCVIAKPDEFLFIDEDDSEKFRAGYQEWSGQKYPSTYTTESRPNHRQSHWLQTDKTRSMGNIS
jgi:hypothetical protein